MPFLDDFLMICLPLLLKQISSIARGQRQIMHQLDNLSNTLRESVGERSNQVRKNRRSMIAEAEHIKVPLILTLAVSGLGILMFKSYLNRNWFCHPVLIRFPPFLNSWNSNYLLVPTKFFGSSTLHRGKDNQTDWSYDFNIFFFRGFEGKEEFSSLSWGF